MQTLNKKQIKEIKDRKNKFSNGLCPYCKIKLERWFKDTVPWCPICSKIFELRGWFLVPTKGPYSRQDYQREKERQDKEEAKKLK